MSDGAALGVSADRALKTIIGGAGQPDASEMHSKDEVLERILLAGMRGGEPESYGDCADMAAGMIYAFLNAHALHGEDLYKSVDAWTDGKLSGLGITGFQWGWAVNCVRWLREEPPEPNPAIITIGEK